MSGMDEAKLKEEIIRMRDEILDIAKPILALRPGSIVTESHFGRSVRILQEVVKLLDLLVKYAVEETEG
jgi:hypothetical protein